MTELTTEWTWWTLHVVLQFVGAWKFGKQLDRWGQP